MNAVSTIVLVSGGSLEPRAVELFVISYPFGIVSAMVMALIFPKVSLTSSVILLYTGLLLRSIVAAVSLAIDDNFLAFLLGILIVVLTSVFVVIGVGGAIKNFKHTAAKKR